MKQRHFLYFLAEAIALVLIGGGQPAAALEPPHEATEIKSAEPPAVVEVLIPAGTFVMGSGAEGDCAPEHEVSLDAFYLDKFEVTNAHYQAFCEATDHRLPEFWGMEVYHCGPAFPDHPVMGISWWDAQEYADWCGKRLPSEAEWEYAARGGLVGAPFPWGDELTPEHANYVQSAHHGTVPVGSYSPNGFGLHDMIGNVNEWVADRYVPDYYAHSPVANPPGPEEGKFRVFRGGGWHTGPGCARVHFRNALPSNWVDFAVGFRCARDADENAQPIQDSQKEE
jgi:sulfatase modifying factor 1